MTITDKQSHGSGIEYSPHHVRGPSEHPSKWWVSGPYAAKARGIDAAGHTFTTEAEVEGMSATDFLLCLGPCPTVDARLFALVYIAASPHTLPMCIAVTGRVWRVEARSDGNYSAAVVIRRHRFL